MSPREPAKRKRTARAGRSGVRRSAAKPSPGASQGLHGGSFSTPRAALRFPALREFTVLYEGASRHITPRAPDISTRGMFINLSEPFPQGAVLRLSFRLPRTQRLIETRCEVRYCLPGVGVGVEYVDLDESSRLAIEDELRSL
jgi:hypothetical protein